MFTSDMIPQLSYCCYRFVSIIILMELVHLIRQDVYATIDLPQSSLPEIICKTNASEELASSKSSQQRPIKHPGARRRKKRSTRSDEEAKKLLQQFCVEQDGEVTDPFLCKMANVKGKGDVYEDRGIKEDDEIDKINREMSGAWLQYTIPIGTTTFVITSMAALYVYLYQEEGQRFKAINKQSGKLKEILDWTAT